MCGVYAIYNSRNIIEDKVLKKGTLTLRHRGPDAQNWKVYHHDHLGIGHTRLSLVDLSSKADQPLEIDDSVISFNGEIYNYQEIRRELEAYGMDFITSSDTEVILKSIQQWGIETALSKFNGCFAFVLYNKKSNKLFVVRDPLGEKQLVYTCTKSGTWIFASEIKALLAYPEVKAEPDIDYFLEQFICNMYVNPSNTCFKNIRHFPSGEYWIFDLKNKTQPIQKQYGDRPLFHNGKQTYSQNNFPEIIETTREIMQSSVNLRLNADCDVGSILSGGLDSSYVTVLASPTHYQRFHTPMLCFTAGYLQKRNRDLQNARMIARANSDILLHEVVVSSAISLDHIKHLTYILEEPLLDKTNIALDQLYKAVYKNQLKTVLNGQGSDEQWLGYYHADPLFTLSKKTFTKENFARYWLDSWYSGELYQDKNMREIAIRLIEKNLLNNYFSYPSKNHLERLQYFSLKTHLATILRSEDRFSMAHSVELRLPYLDPNLLSLSMSIPPKLKLFDKREKYVLRQAAMSVLPSRIIQRKKQGFPHPPDNYDYKMEKILSKEVVMRSTLLNQIFTTKNIQKALTTYPKRERWSLYAAAIMEQVFFT